MNSRASAPEPMPPTPMTGIRTARAACQAMRTAMGRMAGPESPPVPKARRGRNAAEVDHDRSIVGSEPRQDLLDESPHPHALEPDGVEQPGRRLRDPRRGTPVARLEVQALGDDAAQERQVQDPRILHAVAEGPGGRE